MTFVLYRELVGRERERICFCVDEDEDEDEDEDGSYMEFVLHLRFKDMFRCRQNILN